MKVKYLFLGLAILAGSAQAVVFDAYKDDLEADLTCAVYPKTNLKMHLQMLKETGVISPKAALGTAHKLYEFKANPGFQVFGFPLLSVSMVPASKIGGPHLAVKVSATPSALAAAVKPVAAKSGVKTWGQTAGIHTGTGRDESFEVTIGAAPGGGGVNLSCSAFEP